jgi:type I restriction enzyme M protein
MAPKSSADWLWIQHMLATLNIHGKLGIVLDNGALFRGNSEGRIRKQVIEADLVEAVIALPSNLFYNTGSPGCIIILNWAKPKERKGKVLFIYGGDDYLAGKAQNFLRDEDVAKHVAAFNEFKDVERYCRVVDLKEIEKNDYNLNVTRYVDASAPEELVNVAKVIEDLSILENNRSEIDIAMKNYLKELGYHA